MRAWLLLLPIALFGCLGPPPPAQRVTDAARELNLAVRFGRMDVALELTSDKMRKSFLESRVAWGKMVRVMDVELAGLSMKDPDRALVEVDYSWARADEGLLRQTRVAQDWRDEGDGFRLAREERVAGDLGLFGEPIEPDPARMPRPDAHFPTKVIR